MKIAEAARALLLLLCGFAAGAQLGAGPIKENKEVAECSQQK